MTVPPLVFTHVHKCAGSSLRRMLYKKFEPIFGRRSMHVPELTCDAFDNLPMLEERGEPLPEQVMLLADHSPVGLFDDRVLAQDEPFRITLLREPIDRFESYFHFCARQRYIPDKWAEYAARLPALPDAELIELCKFFDSDSGLAYWFDPEGRDPDTAHSNLLRIDIVARYNDLGGFCCMFNARNPYGLTFRRDEILHVNHTDFASRLTTRQRHIVRSVLRDECRIWHSPEVQSAMAGGTTGE